MVEFLFAFVFVALCVYAALKDLETLTITNGLNAAIAFLFIPAVIVAAPGWGLTGAHLATGMVAFVISVFLFVFGVFGGGDAKMIPGVMLWLGPAAVMPFLMVMAVAGGVLALFVILARRLVPATAAPGFAHETMQAGNGVPYGVAIAAGAIWCAPLSPLLQPLGI
ncbi:A24 family peptidase [Henriciella aquimarina]|uniref:A24 family peptidase n=1 Tax=Henriciella aquimarina TaxID=545261 RepID=UPI0009FBCB3E|nr:prepilin peptidase [Henriciella aquimarina]